MNNEHFTPRLKYVDAKFAFRALGVMREGVERTRRLMLDDPGRFEQTRVAGIAADLRSAAELSYALGLPITSVRSMLSDSSHNYRRVFELRGTEMQLPRYSAAIDGGSGHRIGIELLERLPDAADLSLTNSWDGYLAGCSAFAAGESDIARYICSALDDTGADYVGPNSVLCTSNQQAVAYAFRELVAGRVSEMEAWLHRMKCSARDAHLSNHAGMLRAIAADDGGVFLDCLTDLLVWHEKQALQVRNRSESMWYLCLAGLGLLQLAATREVVELADAPSCNKYLPTTLLTASTE